MRDSHFEQKELLPKVRVPLRRVLTLEGNKVRNN